MDHGDHREEIHVDHPHSFDQSEPKAGFIAVFGIGTVVTLALTALAIQFYWSQTREDLVYQQVLAPEGEALKALRKTEDQALGSYGYVDRNTNKVRLPIQRAMELVAQEAQAGKHTWPTTPYRVKSAEELAAGGAPDAGKAGGPASQIKTPDSPAAQGSVNVPSSTKNGH